MGKGERYGKADWRQRRTCGDYAGRCQGGRHVGQNVSNVVNDYEFVSQATRDKVNKAIAELGYTLNMSARNLRKGQTGIIGLAIPDLQMPYFAQLSSLIIAEAKKVGLRVIVEPTQYSREGELEALHGTQQTMLDG